MRIIFVRHGETDYNVRCINQSWLPSKLTEKGKKQAANAGKKLSKHQIGLICSSDLLRTKQTVDEICKHVKAPVRFAKWLRERNCGEFAGKKKGSLMKYTEKIYADFMQYKPKDGESIPEFKKRLKRGFERFLRGNKLNTVLFVAHNACIVNLILHLLNLEDKEYDKYRQGNCSITVIEQVNGKWKLKNRLV